MTGYYQGFNLKSDQKLIKFDVVDEVAYIVLKKIFKKLCSAFYLALKYVHDGFFLFIIIIKNIEKTIHFQLCKVLEITFLNNFSYNLLEKQVRQNLSLFYSVVNLVSLIFILFDLHSFNSLFHFYFYIFFLCFIFSFFTG